MGLSLRNRGIKTLALLAALLPLSATFADTQKTIKIDSEEFVSQVLQSWRERHPEIPLTIKYDLAKFLVLPSLAGGEPLLTYRDDLYWLADQPLEKIQEDEQLPTRHKELLIWMLNQPDGSISPVDFFIRTLELSNGNVTHSLALGWDILSAGNEKIGQVRTNLPREEFPKTKKLGFMPHYKGDLFSSWYHFWGTMFYSFWNSQYKIPGLAKAVGAFVISQEELFFQAMGNASHHI